MRISKTAFSQFIKQFRFRELFNEMGWNNDRTAQPVVVDDVAYTLQAVAEKSGFKVLHCQPTADGRIPDYSTRRKIEIKVTKLFQEHLLIFTDGKKTEQIWLLAVRQAGKPTKLTETRWNSGQAPELLYQRAAGIFFEMDEEEHITIIDVTRRMADNFSQNNEKVTKKFYTEFKKEHTSFLKYIKGIPEKIDQEWYASLMLNRLMFCYFIQKKGFLDNNKNYLRDKLNACMAKKGKVKFYSFYRNFLLVLFHKGLNEPSQHDAVKIEIGRVPYLNGGLFNEHELEERNKGIEIEDQAFERLFDFFDQYEWHLDTRPDSSGREINPDVIGYIFEKYINDRAEMGAYYTKEDITDYISKNCIIPFLFDETKRNYPKAFQPEGALWQWVKNSGTEYIYDAVKKGVELPLPAEIAIGVDTNKHNLIERRKEWNKPAPEEYALPTEIWREVVERRNRFTEIKNKIDAGEIQQINDFITYNLNIRQFVQDAVENTNDPEFLKHFYKALSSVTILDPTCGSGAFLFAAMNILEPLYEACLFRMENFIADSKKGRHKFFEDTLAEVQSPHHPNREYYIYKSIILRNLYGVDIMKEAVEIAKLRLFLKLMATIEVDYRKKNLGVEPLPDIDFNIRAGNTLVGYAKEADIDKAFEEKLDLYNHKEKIKEKCEMASRSFSRYKEIQLSDGDDYSGFKTAKDELNARLLELNSELDKLLHSHSSATKFDAWEKSHQPFHWFAEFYEIINGHGGFDVIIGNPPYVQYSHKSTYSVDSSIFSTYKCMNLYSFCIERSLNLIHAHSFFSMIVPISLIGNSRMAPCLEKLKFSRCLWIANFSGDTHPGTLFTGVQQNISIFVSGPNSKISFHTTDFIRFADSTFEREDLFESQITYFKNEVNLPILKLGHKLQNSIINKILIKRNSFKFFEQSEKNFIYYHDVVHYWVKSFYNKPYFKRDGEDASLSSHYKKLFVPKELKKEVVAVLGSSLFYLWYILKSNGRDLSKDDVLEFNIDFISNSKQNNFLKKLSGLGVRFYEDLERNKKRVVYNKKSGTVKYDQYWVSASKSIIDEIDTVIAEHYSFTEEELDFIINYDIKYRMGKELEGEED